MSDERARELVRMATDLKNERATFERHWQDIADVMRPQAHPFTGTKDATPGEKRTAKVFDAIAPLAAEKHAAVMEAMLSPRNQVWSKLTVADDDLAQDIAVKRYLDEVNRILFRIRYRPSSNLASQLAEAYLSLSLFGTQALYVGDDEGAGIYYKACPLHNVLVDEDHQGRVNRVHRFYRYTAQQIYSAFLGRLPRSEHDAIIARFPVGVRTAYERKATTKFDLMHSVVPRAYIEDGRADFRGMALASSHVFVNDGVTITEGGFRTMPYCVSRYAKAADEIYGRSPGMMVLPDVNMLNRMNKAVIKGAEKAVDPPLLLGNDSLAAFNMTPGAFNYGTLNERGEPMVQPFVSGSRVDLGLDMMEQKRAIIREAFLLDVFQVLTEAPALTATQTLEIAKEKAALLAPVMGRQQSELFGPMTTRELDILSEAGVLPEMPDALIEAGGEVTIEYLSPMAMAQKAEGGVAILRTLESILPLSQTPEGAEAMRIFDIKKTVRELAEVNNFPAKALRSDAEIARLDEEAQAQQEAAQMLEAAPVVAQSLESLSKAQAAGGLSV